MEKREKKEKKQWSNKKRFIVFICLFLVLFVFSSEFLTVCDNVNYANIKGFYKEEKNSIDVAFIGPSEFYADYSPTLAWSEFGYTSYSMAYGGAPGNLYKSMLKEYLKYQSPKLVVFEINGFIQKEEYYTKPAKLHTWLDNIPWSQNKIDTINELVPKDERYSYYVPMASSHSNWNSPITCASHMYTKINIGLKKESYSKSFSTYTREFDATCSGDDKIMLNDKGMGYLKDLLQYCKDQGVEKVLFVRCPHGKKFVEKKKIKKIRKIIESYGYDFVNFNDCYKKSGIDPTKDFYNREHLNVNGMIKFTSYLGKYICDNYSVKTEHSTEQVKRWDECANKTKKIIEQCQEDVKNGIDKHYWEIRIK